MLPVLDRVHGLAHITGGGIPGNLVRILPPDCEAVVDPDAWELPPLFATLQQAGRISTEEMRDVFNLGVGLIAVLPPDGRAGGAGRARGRGVATWPMGEIRRGERRPAFARPLTEIADARRHCSRSRSSLLAGRVHRFGPRAPSAPPTPATPAASAPRRSMPPAPFIPFLGVLVSGGNPGARQRRPARRAGHFSVTARVNAVEIVLPDSRYDGSSATVPGGEKVFAPAPLVEGARRALRRAALGAAGHRRPRLGAARCRPVSSTTSRVDPSAPRIGNMALGLGYGARVGILRETGPLPGISVSIMRRDIPTITYGDIAGGDEFQYSVDLHATNLRLVASKQLGRARRSPPVSAGTGTPATRSIRVRARRPARRQPDVPVELSSSRASAFLDAGVEPGARSSSSARSAIRPARDQKLSTDFEDFDTTKGKFFAGLGLRVGF